MSVQIWLVIGSVLGFLLTLFFIVMVWRSRKPLQQMFFVISAIVLLCSSLLELGQAQQPQNVLAPVPSSVRLAFGVANRNQSVRIGGLQASTGTANWQHAIDARFFTTIDNVIYLNDCFQPNTACIKAISANDGHELWRTTLHGQVNGALLELNNPIVSNGIVLISAKQDTPDYEYEYHILYALRVSDGVEVWHASPASVIAIADGNVYTSDSTYTTIKDGMLTMLGQDNHVDAFRISDGAVAWHSAIGAAQVVAGGGLLLLRVHKEIRALRATDGSLAWKTTLSSDFYNSPPGLLLVSSRNNAYLQTHTGVQDVIAIQASNGAILWSYHKDNAKMFLYLSPSHLYIQEYGEGSAGHISAFDISNGRLSWQQLVKFSDSETPVEVGGVVYVVGDDSFTALRSRDGVRLWQYREPTSGEWVIQFGTPIVMDGVIFTIIINKAAEYDLFSQFCLSYCVPYMSINAFRASDGSLYWRYAEHDLVFGGMSESASSTFMPCNEIMCHSL